MYHGDGSMAINVPDPTERMRTCPHCTLPMIKLPDPMNGSTHWRCTNEDCPAPDKPHEEFERLT
jgi:hypothetical protein